MSVLDKIKEATGVAEPLNDEQAAQAAIEKVEADDKKREQRSKKVKSLKEKLVDKAAKDDDVDRILDGKDDEPDATAGTDATSVDDSVDNSTDNTDESIITKIIDEDATVTTEKDTETVETTEFVRKAKEEDEPMKATAVKDLDFYQNIGKEMFDYDRGYPMSASLREWIKSAVIRDETLIEELIVGELPKVLKAHPDLIGKVKGTATEVANGNILYAVTYISKLDGKEYEDEKDAEASIETLKKVGVTFESAFQGAWRKIEPDGSLGARASRKEVEAYIDNFDGDQAALRKKLHLEKPKKKSDEAPNAKKAAAPKDSDKPAKARKNGNTGDDQE